jgi:hypothetical protein
MNEQELRLNNWVSYGSIPKKVYSIKSISGNGDVCFMGESTLIDANHIDPIPLTFEILEKCGFKWNNNTSQWHIGTNPVTMDWLFEIKPIGETFCYQNGYFIITYIHQLQNLYFALTGTELIINF